MCWRGSTSITRGGSTDCEIRCAHWLFEGECHPEEEPVGSARRLASRRAGPWAPLAGSLRAGQATKNPLLAASVGVADPSQAQGDRQRTLVTGNTWWRP